MLKDNYVLLISTAVLVLYILKHLNSRKHSSLDGRLDELLSLECSAALKGVAILLVYIHHFGQMTSDWYNNHTFLGYMGVSVFLMIAGYATHKRYRMVGTEYLSKGFVTKKIERIIIPHIVITIFFAVLGRNSVSDTLKRLFFIQNNWFLCTILILYLLFYIAYKKESYSSDRILFLLISLYIVGCVVLGVSHVWYNTSLCFFIGVVCSEKETEIMRTDFGPGTITAVSVIVILFFLITSLSILRIFTPVTSSVSSCLFALIMLFIVKSTELRSRLLELIGGITWEFYLAHTKVLYIARNYVGHLMGIYFIVTLVCSLVIAGLIHNVISLAGKRIRGSLNRTD